MKNMSSYYFVIEDLSTSLGKRYLSVKKAKSVELPYDAIEYVSEMSSPNRTDWIITLNW